MIEELGNEEILDSTIVEKHVANYIRRIAFVITGAFIFLFVADAVVSIFVYYGYLPFHLQSIRGGKASYNEFLIGQIITQGLTAIPFLIYFLLYNRVNFNQKKTLLCMLTISSTAALCFCHWKNQYISFLFSIPVVITSPLDKKRNIITLIICQVLIILYAIFHNFFNNVDINILVAAVSSTTLYMFFIVSRKIYATINDLVIEVKQYKDNSDVLYEKLEHDVLTGALSKIALERDLEDKDKYKSLAFLDVDNFKRINDRKGHLVGDNILKLVVMCFKTSQFDIYRYGGDEFIILSKEHSAEDLSNSINENKQKLILSGKELYNCNITISVGIVDITNTDIVDSIIHKADDFMYISKKKGRNMITYQDGESFKTI